MCFWFHTQSLNHFISRVHSFLLSVIALSFSHMLTVQFLGRVLSNCLELGHFMGLGWTGTDGENVSHHEKTKMPERSVWDVTFSGSMAYKIMQECDMVWANSILSVFIATISFKPEPHEIVPVRDLEKTCSGVKWGDNCSKNACFVAHHWTTEQNS